MNTRRSKVVARVLCTIAAIGCASVSATARGGVATGEQLRANESVGVVTRLRRLFADDAPGSPARCLAAAAPRAVASRSSRVAGYDAVGIGLGRFGDATGAVAAFRQIDARAMTRCLAARLAATSDARLRVTSTVERRRAAGPTSFASRIRLRFEPLTCGCTPHPRSPSVSANLDLVYGATGRSLVWFAGVAHRREVAGVAEQERLLRGVLD